MIIDAKERFTSPDQRDDNKGFFYTTPNDFDCVAIAAKLMTLMEEHLEKDDGSRTRADRQNQESPIRHHDES